MNQREGSIDTYTVVVYSGRESEAESEGDAKWGRGGELVLDLADELTKWQSGGCLADEVAVR